MKTIIYNGQVIIDGDNKINNGFVLFDENEIIEVDSMDNIKGYLENKDINKVDAKGLWITPGLIDTHNHGGAGYDFVSTNSEEVNIVGKTMIQEGVTGFLASTTVDNVDEMANMAKRLGSYKYEDGARCLGIHMEGPFMNIKYRAMMKPEFLRDASIEEYRNWQKLSNNFVKTLTLAPEVNGCLDLISEIKDEVVVMVGHSDATVDIVNKARAAGAKGFTHFYNCMSQHLHRAPGVVSAGFIEDEMYCELICDGMHIDKDTIRMTVKTMTPKRLILVTDAMPGKWMDDGKFLFCGYWVIKKDNKTYREGEDRIAGSIKPLNEMARNTLEWCNCTINDIVQMASVNPTRLLKEHKKGTLHKGKDADIVVFDYKMNPQHVFVEGVKKL